MFFTAFVLYILRLFKREDTSVSPMCVYTYWANSWFAYI